MAPHRRSVLALATGAAAIVALAFVGCGKEEETTDESGDGETGDGENEVEAADTSAACQTYEAEDECNDASDDCDWSECSPLTLMTTSLIPTEFCSAVAASTTTNHGDFVCLNTDDSIAYDADDNNCSKDGTPIVVDNGALCHTDCYAVDHVTCTYDSFTCAKVDGTCTPDGLSTSYADGLCEEKTSCQDVSSQEITAEN